MTISLPFPYYEARGSGSEGHDGAQPPNKSASQPVLCQSLLGSHLQTLYPMSCSEMFHLDHHFNTQLKRQIEHNTNKRFNKAKP